MKKEGVTPASMKVASPATTKASGKVAGKKRSAAEANADDEEGTSTTPDAAAKKKSPAKRSPKKRKTATVANAGTAATEKGKSKCLLKKTLKFRSNHLSSCRRC